MHHTARRSASSSKLNGTPFQPSPVMETVVALSFVLDKHVPAAVEEALQAMERACMEKEEVYTWAQTWVEKAVGFAVDDMEADQNDQIQRLTEEIVEQAQEIRELNEELLNVKETGHKLRDEILDVGLLLKIEENACDKLHKQVKVLKRKLWAVRGRKLLKRR